MNTVTQRAADSATDTSLRITRVIKADPETVFDAWTRPRHMKRWSCPEGMNVANAEADLVVGGAYRIEMQNADGAIFTAYGVYRQIERPRRVVYTWQWEQEEHDVGETLVSVAFRDLGGSTEVELVHELFPAAEATAAHEEGWTSCLNRLEGLFG